MEQLENPCFKSIPIQCNDLALDMFEALSECTNFEDVTNGRQGGVLVDMPTDDLVPLVRTTTKYKNCAQKFQPLHKSLAKRICENVKIEGLCFNNALIELYDDSYASMGFHTDQSQDLAENSYICVFSCYSDKVSNRKLVVQNKGTKNCFEVLLEHNSVVLFSTTANHAHLHKIVLDQKAGKQNKWLGITLRLSKTLVSFVDGVPKLPNGNVLRLASAIEAKEFYKCKSIENSTDGMFQYPEFSYTISESDLICPK